MADIADRQQGIADWYAEVRGYRHESGARLGRDVHVVIGLAFYHGADGHHCVMVDGQRPSEHRQFQGTGHFHDGDVGRSGFFEPEKGAIE